VASDKRPRTKKARKRERKAADRHGRTIEEHRTRHDRGLSEPWARPTAER
jgi:hypothetical protein